MVKKIINENNVKNNKDDNKVYLRVEAWKVKQIKSSQVKEENVVYDDWLTVVEIPKQYFIQEYWTVRRVTKKEIDENKYHIKSDKVYVQDNFKDSSLPEYLYLFGEHWLWNIKKTLNWFYLRMIFRIIIILWWMYFLTMWARSWATESVEQNEQIIDKIEEIKEEQTERDRWIIEEHQEEPIIED